MNLSGKINKASRKGLNSSKAATFYVSLSIFPMVKFTIAEKNPFIRLNLTSFNMKKLSKELII